MLGSIASPVEAVLCADLTCHDVAHSEALNIHANHITDACIKAVDTCIPRTCDRQSSVCIAGWSEYIKPLRDESLFWHGFIWVDCNRPKTGAVADCMRRTRAAYHYAIKLPHSKLALHNIYRPPQSNTKIILAFCDVFQVRRHNHIHIHIQVFRW